MDITLRKLLIIDQSTTSTKVALVSENLELINFEMIEHEQICKNPGWTEHDPNVLITNINLCIDLLLSKSSEVMFFLKSG